MITDNNYEQFVLEVLSMFKLSKGTASFHRNDTILFQVFGTLHQMSLIKFSIRLGHYEAEFPWTLACDSLLIFLPIGESLEDA